MKSIECVRQKKVTVTSFTSIADWVNDDDRKGIKESSQELFNDYYSVRRVWLKTLDLFYVPNFIIEKFKYRYG